MINTFPYPMTLAVYKSGTGREVNIKLCFQGGVFGIYLLAVTLNSGACSEGG